MTESPLVTVIAVCYNHSRFLAECLDSIRKQIYQNLQVIIMDDCSQDGSVEAIRAWIERHGIGCKFVAHQQNQGLCRTLNEALSHAQGKYVSMIATDDVWMPEKIARQVAQMEVLPEDIGVLYSDAYQMDESGTPLPTMFIADHLDHKEMPEGNIFSVLLEANFIPAMSTLIRRSVYARVGNYDERLVYEDWDMWLRISRQFRFTYSTYVSAKYRIVSSSLTRAVLRARGNARFTSEFVIAEKVLSLGSLTIQQQALLRGRLASCGRDLYMGDHPAAKKHLWKALRHSADRKTLVTFLLALCGFRHATLQRFQSYFHWRWSAIRNRLR